MNDPPERERRRENEKSNRTKFVREREKMGNKKRFCEYTRKRLVL